jgi:mRNA interferase MazF
MVSRGDVCWVDLGDPRGSSPAKHRPVVVVQADAYSHSALSTVIVVSLTSSTWLAAHPGNVFVPAAASGLDRDSVANVTQLSTVDEGDLGPTVATLPAYLRDDVDAGLRAVLAL